MAAGKVFGLNLRAAAEPFFAYGVAAVTVTDLDPVTISVAWRGGDPPPNLDGLREVVRGLQDTTAPQP